jgi:hypothetical protein
MAPSFRIDGLQLAVFLSCLLRSMLLGTALQDNYVRPAAKPDVNPNGWGSGSLWLGPRNWKKDADEPEQVDSQIATCSFIGCPILDSLRQTWSDCVFLRTSHKCIHEQSSVL